MQKFKVTFKQSGVKKSIIVEANSALLAMQWVENKYNALPIKAKAIDSKRAIAPKKSSKKRLKFKELLFIFQEIYILISSGISLKDALTEVGESSNEKGVREILESIIYGLEQGKPFSSLMAQYYQKDSIIISILEVGEKGGDLDRVLDVIINYLEDTQNNISSVTKALSYPLILITFTIIALSLLLSFVVPQFKEIFSSFGHELPIYTAMLIKSSDFIRAYGIFILGGFVAFCMLLFTQYKISRSVKFFIDKILFFRIFIISRVLYLSAMYKITSSLEVLLFAGINVIEALEMVQKSTTNAYAKSRVEQTISYIKNGKTLAFALRESHLFKNSTIRLIFAGENVGKTPEMMKKVAEIYRKELNGYIGTVSKLIEPFLLIFISFLVLFIALSIFMPIWSLSSGV